MITFSDFLAVLGVLLTVWGIIVTLRKRYPGKITFVEQNAIGLFNSIIKNFSEIKIQYNDQPVSEQMIYLRASFINTGSIDLSTKNDLHKLKIVLPNDYKWINSKITSHSKDIECNIQNSNNELIFDFDLLKRNEFIQFEAFAEAKNSNRLTSTFRGSLTFTHRIPNTAKVDKQPYLEEGQINAKKSEAKAHLTILTILLCVAIAMALYDYVSKSSNLKYKFSDTTNDYVVNISSAGPDKIKIEDPKKDFQTTMSVDEFNKQTNIKAFVTTETLLEHIKKLNGMFFIFVLYLLSMSNNYRKVYKGKKIKNIIEGK